MNRLAAPLLLALLSVSMAVPSCSWFEKKVVTVADDVKTCFGPDVKGDLGDLVKGIGTALICDLASGGGQVPACTIEGLQTIADEIGPSGKKDVQCVVEKLAQDAAGEKVGASPEEVVRTDRAKLLVKAQALSLRSPGNPTPKTGPTCSATSPLVNSCPSGSTYYGSRDGRVGCFDAEWRWLGPARPAPCVSNVDQTVGKSALSGEFASNAPPCYLPGVTKLRSHPGTCVETTRDGVPGVVASDGRFIPIDRSEPAWLTAWKNPPMPDKHVPPVTVYQADGCPSGWVDDGVVYETNPPQLDCYPIKKPAGVTMNEGSVR